MKKHKNEMEYSRQQLKEAKKNTEDE